MRTIQLNEGNKPNRLSSIPGITWNGRYGKWKVGFQKNKKHLFIGYFADLNEAKNALLSMNPTPFKHPLSKNPPQWTLVDDEDFAYLKQFRWYVSSAGYASRTENKNGKRIAIFMHREVLARMGISLEGNQGDHKNRERLDNRRCNLRAATRIENRRNSGKPRNNTSGVKGVSWDSDNKKWRAEITFHRKRIWSKYFLNLEEAAAARAEILPYYHGAFAQC